MQVEHVSGIGFAARRPAQQQGNLPVRPCLLGQVVINDQGVLAAVAVVLAHGAAGIRSDVLHRRRVGRAGGDDRGVFHRAVFFQLVHHVGDGRGLLSDRDVDAFQVLALLVDDGVDGDRGLADFAVADDEFPLAAADGSHGVDGLEAGLHRLPYRLPRDYARRDLFDGVGHGGADRALAVHRPAEGVDHAAFELGAHRHFENAAGAAAALAFLEFQVVAEHHGADGVAFEIERDAVNAAIELDHLAVHDLGQTVNADNAVEYADDGALVAGLHRGIEAFDPLLDDFTDFRGIQLLHVRFLIT